MELANICTRGAKVSRWLVIDNPGFLDRRTNLFNFQFLNGIRPLFNQWLLSSANVRNQSRNRWVDSFRNGEKPQRASEAIAPASVPPFFYTLFPSHLSISSFSLASLYVPPIPFMFPIFSPSLRTRQEPRASLGIATPSLRPPHGLDIQISLIDLRNKSPGWVSGERTNRTCVRFILAPASAFLFRRQIAPRCKRFTE